MQSLSDACAAPENETQLFAFAIAPGSAVALVFALSPSRSFPRRSGSGSPWGFQSHCRTVEYMQREREQSARKGFWRKLTMDTQISERDVLVTSSNLILQLSEFRHVERHAALATSEFLDCSERAADTEVLALNTLFFPRIDCWSTVGSGCNAEKKR